MSTCCKSSSVQSRTGGLKHYISTDMGTKLKSIVRAITLKRVPSVTEIMEVAESGNVKEFIRLITSDPSKLNVRDGRGRGAVHCATVRNHVPILEAVVTYQGNLNLRDSHGNTPLHLAVEMETLEALEFLLANGADTREVNDKAQAPLHMAVETNKTEALKVMSKFRHIVDPNISGEHGRTPLILAAINDFEEAMKILLYEFGACPRKPDNHGFFPIHEAAKHASSRSMEILLTWGEHNGCPREEMISFFDAEGNVPLHSAVHGGDIKAVKLCLSSGAKISTQQHDLSTPVHLACSQGSMEIVKLMFQLQPEEKETCLKSCDLQRMTPIHAASMFDHHELVEYLVSQGASVNILDKERRSPLHLAAFRNGWRTMKTLIRLGANINIKDNDQRNILHAIVIHGGEVDKILDADCSQFMPILEEKDKHGFTALMYAAKQGHIKAVSKLLKLGASIITKNNDGENVFHIACRYGRLNIIQEILRMEQSNSIINEGDGKGRTPLHVSSFYGHVRVVQALMKKGALLHRDHDGKTPLILAAENGHRDTMRLILNIHSHLLDQTDKDGNTALHRAAAENQPSAVDLLLTQNCNLTYNLKGFSAIDFALQNKFAAVALTMVTHRTRGDEILGMSKGKHKSIMLALVAIMPQVVSAVLDRCITNSDNKVDSDQYHIKYDFKWLSLAEPMDESNSLPGEKPDDKHLPILNGMVSYGRVELLSHDLSQKYLQMKWNAYGKYVHLSHLILYLFFLAVLTSYASTYVMNTQNSITNKGSVGDRSTATVEKRAFVTSTPENEPRENVNVTQADNYNSNVTGVSSTSTPLITVTSGGERQGNGNSPNDTTETTYHGYLSGAFILVVAMINLGRECIFIKHHKVKYILDSGNWVFWAMNIACVFMVCAKLGELSDFAKPSASFAAFLGWFYLLLFLQRFDVVGIYVVMFLEILHTLLRVLMIFSILIVAFGLAFYILLNEGNHVPFKYIPISLMRTFSMMLGELDFQNTFVNPHYCGLNNNDDGVVTPPPSKINTGGQSHWTDRSSKAEVCRNDNRQLPHPIPSFLMLGVFWVFMPILLMNLLIGLAVGDIESVRRNAQLKRLAMQVHLHTALEKTLPKFILQRVDKKEVIEYPNARKARLGMVDYLFKYFQPKSHHKDAEKTEEEFSDEVMAAIQQSNEALTNVSTHLENIETLMRLLCHKMELCTDMDFVDEGTQVDDGNPMSDIHTRFKRGATVRATKRPQLSKTPRSDSVA